jgi:hypothetical protein
MASTAISGAGSAGARAALPSLGADTVVIDLSAQRDRSAWHFGAALDVIFIGPADSPLPALTVDEAHNVIVLGGAFEADDPAGALLNFTNITGDVFVEGVRIDARSRPGAQGISVRGAPGHAPGLTVENSCIEPVPAARRHGAVDWARRMIGDRGRSVARPSAAVPDSADVGLNFDGLCALADLTGIELADLVIALATPSGMISLADLSVPASEADEADALDAPPGDPAAVNEVLRFLARDLLSGDAVAFGPLGPARLPAGETGLAAVPAPDTTRALRDLLTAPDSLSGDGGDPMKGLMDFVRQGRAGSGDAVGQGARPRRGRRPLAVVPARSDQALPGAAG